MKQRQAEPNDSEPLKRFQGPEGELEGIKDNPKRERITKIRDGRAPAEGKSDFTHVQSSFSQLP